MSTILKILSLILGVLAVIVCLGCIAWAFWISVIAFGGTLAGGGTLGVAMAAVGTVIWTIVKVFGCALLAGCVAGCGYILAEAIK